MNLGLFTLSNWTKEGTEDIDKAMSRADADTDGKAAYKRNKSINKDAQKNVDAANNLNHGATAVNALSGVAGMGVTAATGGNLLAGAGTKMAMHALAGGLHQKEAGQHDKAAAILDKRAAIGPMARQEHRDKTAEAGFLLKGDLHQQREITMMRGRGEGHKAAEARNERNKDGISAAFAATSATPLAPSALLAGMAASSAKSDGAGYIVQRAAQKATGALTKKAQGLLFAQPIAGKLEDRSAVARGYGPDTTAPKDTTFTRSAKQEAKLASRLNARNQLNAFHSAAAASKGSESREHEISAKIKPSIRETVKNRLATGQLSPSALMRHMRRRVE
ncbi:hypothetical protein N9Y97_01860 [Pseudomonadales bacterium]|nr:hypothetical protein [Pseudomonadales bacterium]